MTLIDVAVKITDTKCSEGVFMIYELRIYEAIPGKFEKINARFRDYTLSLLEKHGATNVGYWTYEVGNSDELVYILSFPSADARVKTWDDFRNDPEWLRVKQETEIDGPIVAKVKNWILSPTDYSPMQ